MAEPGSVLVLNAGSSSIKASLDRGGVSSRRAQVDLRRDGTTLTLSPEDGSSHTQRLPGKDVDRWQAALDALLNALSDEGQLPPPAAVGHRVVHGGRFFAEPVVITPEVIETLESLTPLAPLHQPHGLAGIRAICERFQAFPRSPASTQPSIAPARRWPAAMRCLANGTIAASNGMAFMACRISRLSSGFLWSRAGCRAGWSSRTWGPGPAWPQSWMGRASPQPWDSHRSTGW
jgi:hypothetical protein